MARFRDIPYAARHVGVWTFLKRLVGQILNNYLTVWAAALAYSWLFALFPFLIFIVAVLPLLPAQARLAVQDELREAVANVVPAANLQDDDAADTAIMGPPTPGGSAQVDPDRVAQRAGASVTEAAADARLEATDPVAPDPAAERAKQEQLQQVGQVVVDVVDDILQEDQPGLLSVAIAVAIWVASGGMSMTMSGLDRAYGVLDPRPFWLQRLYAIGLTIVTGFLVLLVLVLLPIGTLVLNVLDWVGIFDIVRGWARLLIDLARNAIAMVLIAMIISLIYWAGTSVRMHYRLLTPGAAFAVVSWLLLGFGFRLYIEQFQGARSYVATYGTIAGVAILLLLFYLFALTLMIGAAINAELSFARLGIRPGQRPTKEAAHAEDLDEEERALAQQLRDQSAEEAKAAVMPQELVNEQVTPRPREYEEPSAGEARTADAQATDVQTDARAPRP